MILHRPIVFLDIETTGLNFERDRITELAGVRVNPDGSEDEYQTLVNPERKIPAEVVRLTGITNEMVAGKPTFRGVADEWGAFIEDADVGGYNVVRFDVPFMEAEYRRLGRWLPGPVDRTILDPGQILRKYERRSLNWAHNFYLGTGIVDAHRAMNDAKATLNIYKAQLDKYHLAKTPGEITRDIMFPYVDTERKFKEEGGDVVFNFGQYRGLKLRDVAREEPTYIDWIRQEMSPEIVRLVNRFVGDLAPPPPMEVPPAPDPGLFD